MLKETTEANYSELLVHAERTAVERPQTFYSIKKVEHEISTQEEQEIPYYYKVKKYDAATAIARANSMQADYTSSYTTEEVAYSTISPSEASSKGYTLGKKSVTKTVKKKIEDLSTYTYKKDATIGYYNQIRFADTLCEYLWYKVHARRRTSTYRAITLVLAF